MLKVLELFSGYGSQSLALKKYGVEFKSVGISEIDKYAIQAYETLHGQVKNYGDIMKINPLALPDHDLCTYSFPCQDISMAGKQKGLEEGSGSRSSLLWECQKIIELKRPKYLMMENVKNLVGKKHKPDFERWLKVLEYLGYNNYWKVINAKHCGVPQKRERVFCVSILKEHDNFDFKFYDDFDSGIRLKDILEDQVDEKYYLTDKKVLELFERFKINNITDLAERIGATNTAGYSRTIRVGGRISHIKRSNFSIIQESCAIRGRNPANPKSRKSGEQTLQMVEISKSPSISNCITTVQKDSMIVELPCFRLRYYTPREQFRLMGLNDSDIDKIQATGISNTQQYKMAGNSIVLHCMKFLKQLKF